MRLDSERVVGRSGVVRNRTGASSSRWSSLLAVPQTLELGSQLIAPDELRESPFNPRTISDERMASLKRALQHDGEMLRARPIIAMPDGYVVAGNMRLRAAKELGWDEVPVFVADLDPQRAREWMLRDNQEYGEYVPDQLARLIDTHRAEGGDISLLGFDDDELQKVLESLEGEPVVPVPEDQIEPDLKGEVLVEIYCSREALEAMNPTLEEWATLDGVELNISG